MAARFLLTMHKYGQGGAERVAMLLANGFAAAGNVAEIVLLTAGGPGEAALEALRDPAVTVTVAGPPIGSRKRELARGLPLIVRRIRAARPHVVLATCNNIGLVTAYAALLAPRRGVRFAIKVTNPVLRPRDRTWLARAYRRRLYDFIFSRFDRILILTDAERHTLATLYPHHAAKMHTVLNPYVSDSMLADFIPATPPCGAPRTILALARMMPQKRLDLLVTAFAAMKRGRDRLVILGDGPERPGLEALVARLGVGDRVDMPGYTADVVPWLRRADLFALSSHHEGLPAAAIEALAANCPVVTTDCFAGAHALLDGAEQCAVVPRGDVAALAAALDRGLDYASRPTSLRAIAFPYRVQGAVESHLAALAPLVEAAGRERGS